MLIYIILYSMLLPGILYDAVRKSLSAKKVVLGFYVLLFTLFRGLRWNTGTDWSQYLWHFQYLNIDNVFSYSRYGGDETLEPLYALINVLVGFVGNYSLFLLVTNLFVLYTYYWFSIKYTPKPVVTFALLLLCASFFPVRMELAVTVLMWTIPSLVHRDFKSFLFVTVLAFLIHKATIIYLPFTALSSRVVFANRLVYGMHLYDKRSAYK